MASQFGQDQFIFNLLDLCGGREKHGHIVEAGAASPSHVSNSLLFLEEGYSLRLIEGDIRMSSEWNQVTGDIRLLEQYVPYKEDGMDKTLINFEDLPTDFDALFLDINGGEWQLIRGMSEYRPKIICVEYDNAYPLSIDYVPSFFGYSPQTGQASGQAFHRMLSKKRYCFCKAFFQDYVYISEEFLSAIISVKPDFKYGTKEFLKTAHNALYSPEAVFCNQAETQASAGISFYADKLRALASDRHGNEAAHMYSYILSHALAAANVIAQKRSHEYVANYMESLESFVDEYSFLINPLMNPRK